MDYIKRDMEQLILSLSREYACVLVSGPRQVGKTTMLEHIKPQGMSVVTLDDLSERQLARSDPETFFALHPLPVMIDSTLPMCRGSSHSSSALARPESERRYFSAISCASLAVEASG